MSILVFNRWSMDGISVHDPGLKDYINISPRVIPRTGGRSASNRFHKSIHTFIVERFMNRLMSAGHKAKKHIISSGSTTGKGATIFKITEDALEMLEKRTGKNPLAILIQAIENAAPREEIITIEYGGAKYPKAVEVAPQRRVDQAIKYMVQTACQKAFNSKKSMVSALADEIMNAFNRSNQSGAISKKLELERQADSSR